MFVLDDVARDTHAKTRTLPDRLGGEEILEEMLFHLIGHALSIVGNADEERGARVKGHGGHRNFDGGLVVVTCRLGLVPHSIAGIVHHVQHGATQVLRYDHHQWQTFLILLMNGDIEALMIRPHGMI